MGSRGKPARPIVIAVCGSPGAGKTSVASAAALRLGVPLLTRDELKQGLGLSSGSVDPDDLAQMPPDFHIAGGPFTVRAERAMVAAAFTLASSGVTFVVETSVLSDDLLDTVAACGAVVLAVHVVASKQTIGKRLQARAVDGGAVAQQLAEQFDRGEMVPSIFRPPTRVDVVVELDTSEDDEPNTRTIETALIALLR